VFEGTLDESIREFMAKPESTRHLYKIHAVPQPPLITEVLLGRYSQISVRSGLLL
jgi:hypothetical protein